MKATAPTSRCLVLLLIGGVLLATACSSDDPLAPTDPGADGVIHIPAEMATLAAAVAAAADGDTLKIASGAYDGVATVNKDLVIMGMAGGDARPILDTTDGPLRVEVAPAGRVELRDLRLGGGDPALALNVTDGRVVVVDCQVVGATNGIVVNGSGSYPTAIIAATDFVDCGTDAGVGVGLRVQGDSQVAVGSGVTFTGSGGGSGFAITVVDDARLHVEGATFTGLDGGGQGVTAAAGNGRLSFSSARFEDCAGTLIDAAGASAGLAFTEFVDCRGTMIRQRGAGAGLSVIACHTRGCAGTFLDLVTGLTMELLLCSFVDHTGPLFVLGDGATLELLACTVVGTDTPLATVGTGGAQIDLARCLVVDAATPVIAGGTIAIANTDLWRSNGSPAWAGLEAFAAVDGNIESDPLFCDAGAGDYSISAQSPCVLENMPMGAFEVGCE